MKKKHLVLPCIIVLLASALAIQQSQYPNWTTFSNQPPRLDPSTGQSQSGFELLGIKKTERNAYTLVINAPGIPKTTSNRQNPYSPPNAFDLRAVTSSGHSWKMGWRIDSSQSSSYNMGDVPLRSMGFPDPMILAELPLAYPPGCQWVDVEMNDRHGAKARWHLTNLQTARDIIPAPANQSNIYAKDGVFLRLDGQWRHWDTQSHQEWQGELSLSGCALPNPSRKWKVEPAGAQPQWISYHEPTGPTPRGQSFVKFDTTVPSIENANLTRAKLLFGSGLVGYDPASNQYGVMYFDLMEYAVGKDGEETLLSCTPIALAARLIDKGSQEKLYPKAFQR